MHKSDYDEDVTPEEAAKGHESPGVAAKPSPGMMNKPPAMSTNVKAKGTGNFAALMKTGAAAVTAPSVSGGKFGTAVTSKMRRKGAAKGFLKGLYGR